MNIDLPISQINNEREQACVEASEREMVKYLLGELSPELERQVETAYFADDQFFDRLQALKEKLIDDYLHGNLSAEDLRSFEQHFLASPAQRERVEFARTLMHSLSSPKLNVD